MHVKYTSEKMAKAVLIFAVCWLILRLFLSLTDSRIQTCSMQATCGPGRVTHYSQKWPHSAFRFEPPCDNSQMVADSESI